MQRKLRIRLLPDKAQQARISTSLEMNNRVYNAVRNDLMRRGASDRKNPKSYSYLRDPDYCDYEQEAATMEGRFATPDVDPGAARGAIREAFADYQRYVWGLDETWDSSNRYYPFEAGRSGRWWYHVSCANDDVVLGHGRIWIPRVGDVECLAWPTYPLKVVKAFVEKIFLDPPMYELFAVCEDAREDPWGRAEFDPEDYMTRLGRRRHRTACATATRSLAHGC